MALIRGVTSLYPCPRCLIPQADQGDPSTVAPSRTAEGTKNMIDKARSQRLLGEKEEVLRGAGLRDIDVGRCVPILSVCYFPHAP